jgi:hypothetical protein
MVIARKRNEYDDWSCDTIVDAYLKGIKNFDDLAYRRAKKVQWLTQES